MHLGLAAPRALIVQIFTPETSTEALWHLTILTFLVSSTYFLAHFSLILPVRRAQNLINSALLANIQDLSAIPEKLKSKPAIKEIADLNAAVARLAEKLDGEEKDDAISALTRKRGQGKRSEREPIAPVASPTSIVAISKQFSANSASNASSISDEDKASSEQLDLGTLLTFPADVLERIQEVLPKDDLRMAYISVEGGAKLRLLACAGTSETDKLLLESFLSHSEEVISAVMMRDYVQISDKSFNQYGLADLKHHLDVAKPLFSRWKKRPAPGKE